jgi:hypothetical protein
MKILPALFVCSLAAPAFAQVDIPTGDPVHGACQGIGSVANLFKQLEADWPTRPGKEVRSSLNEIEKTSTLWGPDCRAIPLQQAVMAQLPKWQKRAKAAAARDRAVLAMVRGKNASSGDDYSAEVAKEYFTLAVQAWDEAFAIAPDFKGGTIKIDEWKGQAKSAGDWRAMSQQKLSEL